MAFLQDLKLPKVHLIGHHSGSAHGMEMAAVYPDAFLSVALSGPALMTEEEQAAAYKTIGKKWSEVSAVFTCTAQVYCSKNSVASRGRC